MEENQITTPVEETPAEAVNESAQNETAEKAVQEGTVYVSPAQAATVYTPSAQTEPKQIHVAALVMGILSIVFSLLFAIVGDILGIIGIVLSIAKKKEYRTTASLVCSIIGLVLSIVNHVAGALLISYIATLM